MIPLWRPCKPHAIVTMRRAPSYVRTLSIEAIPLQVRGSYLLQTK